MSQTIYKNHEELSEKLFKNPTAEYRGTPFWAWNGELKKELLSEQIDAFKQMGFGGAHMHVRTGLTQKYLGKEHMEMIKHCTEKFKKEKMLSWLYDEDRYASGAAGGYVTKDIRFREKKLIMSCSPRKTDDYCSFLTCYDVVLDNDGYLSSYKKITQEQSAQGTKWYCYLNIEKESNSWHNGQTYVDALSKDAIKAFIDITYTAYEKTVGEDFGKAVPAIFTDEPNFGAKSFPVLSTDKKDIVCPWTFDLVERFIKSYGYDIMDYLPEVFWEKQDGSVSVHRYHLHDHITEMFAAAFADQCGKWCDKHGIMLTGHLLYEKGLNDQTTFVGEVMRSYRGFGLPGIDILCDQHEYSTAKQCQSAVNQYGRCGMVSELYGVTNWDYDFRGHKHQGDWQAAMGVTVRVPHLAFYSMEGEAKRDYPASIGYQSSWFDQYKYVEDHFARVNTALTRGKPHVRVGVIHPIESFWLHYGPIDKTARIRNKLEKEFSKLLEYLAFGTIDFDYICESTLPKLCKNGKKPFKVGEMSYDVIVVSSCETLRSSTLERLEQFESSGGKIVFVGKAPSLCDALPSDRGAELYKKCTQVAFDEAEILDSLSDVRELTLLLPDGTQTKDLIYRMRKESNGTKWLFVAGGVVYKNQDIPTFKEVTLKLKGKYTPTLYDTLTGDIKPIEFEICNGYTLIKQRFYNHDSLLLRLDKYTKNSEYKPKPEKKLSCKEIVFPHKNTFSLSEDNVYVIDVAEFKLDDGEWMPTEEILRLDTKCREMLGWPVMSGKMVQPWVTPEAPIEHYVTLRCKIMSELDVENAFLAIEKADKVAITLNGKKINSEAQGYFVDKHIPKIALPGLKKGENLLELVCPIGNRTSVEYAYILGQFGVSVAGREKTITKLNSSIGFDDICKQGLPFYGANITYNCEIETDSKGTLSLHAPVYRGAMISVSVDGKEKGIIAYSPYTLDIKGVSAGKHTIKLTLYGTRFNCLGQLHCRHNPAFTWYGPASYRTKGDMWSYEYELKPQGILRTPTCILKK